MNLTSCIPAGRQQEELRLPGGEGSLGHLPGPPAQAVGLLSGQGGPGPLWPGRAADRAAGGALPPRGRRQLSRDLPGGGALPLLLLLFLPGGHGDQREGHRPGGGRRRGGHLPEELAI